MKHKTLKIACKDLPPGPTGPSGATGPMGPPFNTGDTGALVFFDGTSLTTSPLLIYDPNFFPLGRLLTLGDLFIDGKLTVNGGIDPPYIQLTPQPSLPYSGTGTVWVDQSHHLRLDLVEIAEKTPVIYSYYKNTGSQIISGNTLIHNGTIVEAVNDSMSGFHFNATITGLYSINAFTNFVINGTSLNGQLIIKAVPTISSIDIASETALVGNYSSNSISASLFGYLLLNAGDSVAIYVNPVILLGTLSGLTLTNSRFQVTLANVI